MKNKLIGLVVMVLLLGACESTIIIVKGNRHNISTEESLKVDSTSIKLNTAKSKGN